MTKATAKPAAVTMRPIETLIPYASNARTHTDEQVAQIAASIKEFGWTNPILVDAENGIIAGHGRVMAARALGLKQIPCIELTGLTDAQRRAYILADNKLAINAGWDVQMLGLELARLDEDSFNVELVGFDASELAELKLPEPDDDPGDDEPPADGKGYVIQYNIIFEDEEQQDDWFAFLKTLKDRYPDAETVAHRLQLMLREDGYVTR